MKTIATLKIIAFSAMIVGCTGQVPNSFRLQNQQQNFDAQLEVNTKIDLLWVVDNSSSMDITQQKLRNGFSAFANKYLQPTWDIRVAVITTDTYLADSAFSPYLAKVIPGTTGMSSAYISSRLATWSNPSSNPTLLNTATGVFTGGVKYGDLVPSWGANYARLLEGMHDGPIPALCFETMAYFFHGATHCRVRDLPGANTGVANCINPGAGEDSESQCVNTVQNNTVRSGRAIIETMPPAGTEATASWKQQLQDDFMVNVSTGSAGMGSERGLGSMLQLLADNENSTTAFFRKGSTRVIIFVSDEEDQTMEIESPQAVGFNPFSHYRCDKPGLTALNSAGAIASYCCTGGSCTFGAEGTSCPSKTVDNYTYTPSTCADPDRLLPVDTAKARLDAFFRQLDGTADGSPNYFVTAIVPLTGDAIQSMQASRAQDDTAAGALKTTATDRGDRYIALATAVGNGSLTMNIAESDYSPILEQIGRSIIEKQGTFQLERAPTEKEEVAVKVKHLDGSYSVVAPSAYVISERSIVINDLNTVLGFRSGDQIVINYQPNSVY